MADAQDFVDNPTPESAAPPAGGFKEVPQSGFTIPNIAVAHEFFSDPEALAQMAQIYFKNGSKRGIEWLKRGHEAAKENVFEAMGHLQRGDTNAAVQAFNQSGTFNDATGITKNADGTFTVERSGGEPTTFNLDQLQKSFLSPKDYFAQQQHEQTTGIAKEKLDIDRGSLAVHRQLADQQGEYQKGMLKNTEELNATRAQRVTDQAEAARQIAEAKGMGGKALNELATKFGPKATWDAAYKDAQTGGATPEAAQAAADRAVVANLFNPIKVDPKSGAVAVLDPFDTTRALRQFANVAEYETYVGRKLPRGTSGASPEAPKAPAAKSSGASGGGLLRRLLPSPTVPTEKFISGADDAQLQDLSRDPKADLSMRNNAVNELQRRHRTLAPPDQPQVY